MNVIEEKVERINKQLNEIEVKKNKELFLTEMKKIGIEKLPYSYTALKQFIDAETMSYHYNKHYKGYVEKLNKALSKGKYGDLELEDIIKTKDEEIERLTHICGILKTTNDVLGKQF